MHDLYGYQLPCLFHSIAQKLDKSVEETRVQILAKVGLLVELGLPTETAAKVFLAGVRSRTAAVELATFVTNPVASVSRIRNALLDSATVKGAFSLGVRIDSRTAKTFFQQNTAHQKLRPRNGQGSGWMLRAK
ncbi:MAG: hypothetical protein IPL59_15385 [Candidatus Competibacteraceae bacterium]|nr:hypothetical protein [Candidatus Competibacteraceae bacterium]